ncbi:MAG: gephyrin-like molybdotransferase Glp [Amaricoccus sp.]
MTPPISVAEAHARLIRLFATLPADDVPLASAAGRVLARDVVAPRDQPPFAASAMDGYAVRSTDAAPGARLAVVGTASAGTGFTGHVGRGEAVRIFTGAPLPEGADLVVMQEDVAVDGGTILLRAAAEVSNVRPAGGDFRAGARIAAPRRLRPVDVALLAAMNMARAPVARRPAVALVSTGDELVMPGENLAPGQIVASNAFGLKGMLEAAGAEVRLLPIARDTPEDLAAAYRLCAGNDLIVTLGGASVGDFDLVARTALARGLELDFHRVAMRPGKPLMAGRLDGTPLVGLPGNPVSALVTGRLFLVAAVERMQGLSGDLPPTQSASLAADVEPNGPRAHYMRARVDAGPTGWTCRPFPSQDSSLLSVLCEANALMVRQPSDPALPEGAPVEFIWL